MYTHCIQSLFRVKCNYEFIKNRFKNVFTVFIVFFWTNEYSIIISDLTTGRTKKTKLREII